MSGPAGTAPGGAVDWEAIERSPEFQELVARKRRFVVPRVVFFLVWYCGFVLLCGYAPGFMGERIYEGLTVGYVLALTQFLMVWYLAWSYVRKADREFEPLEHEAVRSIESGELSGHGRTGSGRFEREEPAATPAATREVAP
jgi:uncharacterized membrane protein (DUF485 family)